MTDDELQNLIADALRAEENRMPEMGWIDKEASWADLERRLIAIEQEEAVQSKSTTTCAIRQLRKIVQKARDMKYYLLGKCWGKC